MTRKIILFLVAVVFGFGVVFIYYEVVSFPRINIQIPTLSLSNIIHNTLFSLVKPPSESLTGTIGSMTGDVEFQDRIATESARIFAPVVIEQGENLSTGIDGTVSAQFDNQAEIILFPKTEVDFIQALPADIVLAQTSGTAEFKKLSDTPVTIRSLHLLTESGGDVKISLDDKKPIVTVTVLSGTATVAYNNINNVSKVLTIQKGKTLTFNDKTRKVSLK